MNAHWERTSHRRYWNFNKSHLVRLKYLRDAHPLAVSRDDWPLRSERVMAIFLANRADELGKRLFHYDHEEHQNPDEFGYYQNLNRKQEKKVLPAQCVATAKVYLRRFYTKVHMRDTNPYMVVAACIYLASKVEEFPISNHQVAMEMQSIWYRYAPNDTSHLCEYEFWVVTVLCGRLIVHHPFHHLDYFCHRLNLSPLERCTAYSIIHDTYKTDLSLLSSPQEIALTCVLIAVLLGQTPSSSRRTPSVQVGHRRRCRPQFAHLLSDALVNTSHSQQLRTQRMQDIHKSYENEGYDNDALLDCAHEMVTMYEVERYYSDGECTRIVREFLDKRAGDLIQL